jgi:hypothetical protein
LATIVVSGFCFFKDSGMMLKYEQPDIPVRFGREWDEIQLCADNLAFLSP